jgi:hypothetical protein
LDYLNTATSHRILRLMHHDITKKKHFCFYNLNWILKSMVLWVVVPYSSERSWNFGAIYRFHLQVPEVIQARTRNYNIENRAIHSRCHENLKSNINWILIKTSITKIHIFFGHTVHTIWASIHLLEPNFLTTRYTRLDKHVTPRVPSKIYIYLFILTLQNWEVIFNTGIYDNIISYVVDWCCSK